MTSSAFLLFIFLIQLTEIQAASRYEIGDTAGIVSIVLLIAAGVISLAVTIMFGYIVYKLWNGNFGRKYYYDTRTSRKKMVTNMHGHDHDQQDGSRYSTFTTEPVYSTVNKGVSEEVVEAGNDTAIVEAKVDEQEYRSEEVIVSQAPPTDQAEMETQELVIVFDDNDDVVDVLTHVT